ncbi:FkbM family methyltransferase [Heliobacterium chlorum]|uniref:FkbM family methyltransferase n=1 Tax=Heliobacterium chlorum TaxID=2698 RepID=A0ABR7T369_HELCL|nr:FkbM family methyltransferase [Heliobacterium chlorum]MBC9784299.1 FkbM family methyltransferase [Heliobacterium chlorum]
MKTFEYPLEELKTLLSESYESVVQRERSAFERFSEGESSIVLFGTDELSKATLAGLRKVGIEPLGFIDDYPKRCATTIDGLSVFSPQEAVRYFGHQPIYLVTKWEHGANRGFLSIKSELRKFGCAKIVPFPMLYWKYPNLFFPLLFWDLPHKLIDESALILKAFELWEDEYSKQAFVAQLRWRLWLDYECLPQKEGTAYFPVHLFCAIPNEVFVDCGAYDGDTLRTFKEMNESFKKYIAFEPDRYNYSRLQKVIEEFNDERIHAFPFAVADEGKAVPFVSLGSPKSNINPFAKEQVKAITLDQIFEDEVCTFIKMDVEGSELSALQGASDIIKRDLPILSVCVYHRDDHLWKVPLYISSLTDQYTFYLGVHENEGYEWVCYAIPKSRRR